MSEENKVYTQEEFQRELDKRITKALKTQEDKLSQKYMSELEGVKSELTSEKEKAILDAITKERQEVELARKELEREKLKGFITSNLSQKNMKADFTDFILATSECETSALEQIEKFSSLMSSSHEQFIHEKLVGQTPVVPAVGEGNNTSSTDAFVRSFLGQ